jgi:hypothetical protein
LGQIEGENVSIPQPLEPFLGSLAAFQRLLVRFGDQGIVIGGVAASLLGKPRLTADVDGLLIISTNQLPELMKAAQEEGFEPRIQNAVEFARQNRVLLLLHRETNIPVDLAIGILPFEMEAVERSKLYSVGDFAIRLPTPEDLIILKGAAGRARDLEDIRTLCAAYPNLDWVRIESWLKEFAAILERPEIWDAVATIRRESKEE